MNINRMLMLATAVASLTANAQVKLNDKNANAYDLGYGVEISNFLSTASATTITGEELQQTSATNLAQALYGRLPALRLYRKAASRATKIRVPRLIFVAITRLTIKVFSSLSMATSVPSTPQCRGSGERYHPQGCCCYGTSWP